MRVAIGEGLLDRIDREERSVWRFFSMLNEVCIYKLLDFQVRRCDVLDYVGEILKGWLVPIGHLERILELALSTTVLGDCTEMTRRKPSNTSLSLLLSSSFFNCSGGRGREEDLRAKLASLAASRVRSLAVYALIESLRRKNLTHLTRLQHTRYF
jgi:hypothetical protein